MKYVYAYMIKRIWVKAIYNFDLYLFVEEFFKKSVPKHYSRYFWMIFFIKLFPKWPKIWNCRPPWFGSQKEKYMPLPAWKFIPTISTVESISQFMGIYGIYIIFCLLSQFRLHFCFSSNSEIEKAQLKRLGFIQNASLAIRVKILKLNI